MLMWPAFGNSAYSLPGMPSWRTRAARGFVVRSCSPTSTRVGLEIAVPRTGEVPETLRRVHGALGKPRRDRAVEVERVLYPHQLSAVLRRLDGLLPLPGLRDRLAGLAHLLQRGLDVGHQLRARVAAAGDDVAGGRAEVDGVPGRDDRAERVAEQCEAVEPKRLGEQVDIAREDLQAESRRVDALAPPLSALVDVEDAELLAERVEPRPQVDVVEPSTAVEHDEREPLVAHRFDEERVSVGELDVQLLASFQSSPTPTSTASGGSRS